MLQKALHYCILEENENKTAAAADAYIDSDFSGLCFYTRGSDGVWEKHLTAPAWLDGNGNEYQYAFCQSFSIEDGWHSPVEEGIHMAVQKNKEPYETAVLPISGEGDDWFSSDGSIYVEDFNFDGCPDIGIEAGSSSNWGGYNTMIYLCGGKDKAKSYTYTDHFLGCPTPNPEKRLLYGFNRGSAAVTSYYAYEYRNGHFAEVASLDEEWKTDSETGREYIEYTVSEENGNVERYIDRLPLKWKEFWD